MATQVVMPKLSPTMEEGQLSRWLKKEGDTVAMGEPLAEIDTDKATMEMQALSAGVLRKILVKEGETVPLGQPIAIIGQPDEDISSLVGQQPSPTILSPAPQKAAPAQQQPQARGNGGKPSPQPVSQPAGRLVVSPLAARMAAEAGIDLRSLNGTGPGGRIIKRDVESAISQTKTTETAPARHLRAVEPSPLPEPPLGASSYHDEPASEMRRTIARRLVTSLGPVPHFFLTTEIEMDRAAEMRRSINSLDPELQITINDIIIKIAASALSRHPQVNASYQDKTVRYYDHADIGVAVAVDEGLITPVVRSAEQKSLRQIASEVRDLAERARNRRLKPEEYTGATFSVSNLGMFGIDEFTAIINPPEGAILAVGAMSPKPVVRDNQVVVRQMIRVTLSCDHRVIDGATGAKFLQTFKKYLENPLYLIV